MSVDASSDSSGCRTPSYSASEANRTHDRVAALSTRASTNEPAPMPGSSSTTRACTISSGAARRERPVRRRYGSRRRAAESAQRRASVALTSSARDRSTPAAPMESVPSPVVRNSRATSPRSVRMTVGSFACGGEWSGVPIVNRNVSKGIVRFRSMGRWEEGEYVHLLPRARLLSPGNLDSGAETESRPSARAQGRLSDLARSRRCTEASSSPYGQCLVCRQKSAPCYSAH